MAATMAAPCTRKIDAPHLPTDRKCCMFCFHAKSFIQQYFRCPKTMRQPSSFVRCCKVERYAALHTHARNDLLVDDFKKWKKKHQPRSHLLRPPRLRVSRCIRAAREGQGISIKVEHASTYPFRASIYSDDVWRTHGKMMCQHEQRLMGTPCDDQRGVIFCAFCVPPASDLVRVISLCSGCGTDEVWPYRQLQLSEPDHDTHASSSSTGSLLLPLEAAQETVQRRRAHA